jgi:ankyrin repeat protein
VTIAGVVVSQWINIQNIDGDTALHKALASGGEQVARRLIQRGASTDIKNQRGQLPIDATTNNAVRTVVSNIVKGMCGSLIKSVDQRITALLHQST